MPLLEALFPHKHYTGKSRLQSQAEQMTDFYATDRVQLQDFLLNTINTGHVSRKAYGTSIRAVNVSRGNRQGNNAFRESILRVGYLVP